MPPRKFQFLTVKHFKYINIVVIRVLPAPPWTASFRKERPCGGRATFASTYLGFNQSQRVLKPQHEGLTSPTGRYWCKWYQLIVLQSKNGTSLFRSDVASSSHYATVSTTRPNSQSFIPIQSRITNRHNEEKDVDATTMSRYGSAHQSITKK